LKTSWGTTWGLREPHGNTLGTHWEQEKKPPKILSPTPQKEKNTGPLMSACM